MSQEFYDMRSLNGYDAGINLITGERAAGKSYQVKKNVMHELVTNPDSNFVFCVKQMKDKSLLRVKTYWNDMVGPGTPYPDFLMKKEGDFYWLENTLTGEKRQRGAIVSLKEADETKSAVFPATRLIEEEFLNEEGKYNTVQEDPDYEVQQLMKIMSTFFRDKSMKFNDKAKAYLVSNAYTLNNPYFRYWGFMDQVLKNPHKNFFSVMEGAVVMERTGIKSIQYKYAKGDDATAGKWTDFSNELNIIKHPKVREHKIRFQFSFDSKLWFSVADYNETFIVFRDKLRESTIKFTANDIARKGMFRLTMLKKTYSDIFAGLSYCYNRNEAFYDSIHSYSYTKNLVDF